METWLTLSNLELFIAFKAAESINIGGPSSNTSLMNSFACGYKTQHVVHVNAEELNRT